ncbi:hypothetical protein L210DRAFT_3420663, partial [Boletus edulis BED1]
SNPHAILDSSQHVIAVLVGRASGTFDGAILEATAEFQRHSENLSNNAQFPSGNRPARGQFQAVITGISYGGGQPMPMQSAVPSAYKTAEEELRKSPAMQRLAGFQSRVFETYFPKLHQYYTASLSKLYSHFPTLQRPYESSVMPAAAFNLGPATVCRPHRDSANLSFGLCPITALGNFDPKTGGHIVLEELRLVITFPPGATVLIPSAVITHSNTKIKEGETRYSFTQYAAGALFCYVQNGMQSESQTMKDLAGPSNREQLLRHKEARRERWSQGVDLFPKVSDYHLSSN